MQNPVVSLLKEMIRRTDKKLLIMMSLPETALRYEIELIPKFFGKVAMKKGRKYKPFSSFERLLTQFSKK